MLTYAIGDVHGCLGKLARLIDGCLQHGGNEPARFVFIGDYVDRGPHSREVVELLMQAQRERPGEVVCLRGNHEAIMLEAVHTGDDRLWLVNGASYTYASYGIEQATDMPAAHVAWVAALPLSFDDGRRYFVHAGIDPDVPLDAQTERARLWIREPFLSSTRDHGRLIVHGHTPSATGLPDVRPNRVNIDTGAVYGGPLTAAVFSDEATAPIEFLSSE